MAIFQVVAGMVGLFGCVWLVVVGVWGFFCWLGFSDCLGYFDKSVDCKERRGFDFSQPKVVIHACSRHKGMGTSCICLACNCSPSAQMNKKRFQQPSEFLFMLKHLVYGNYLTEMNSFFLTEMSRKL